MTMRKAMTRVTALLVLVAASMLQGDLGKTSTVIQLMLMAVQVVTMSYVVLAMALVPEDDDDEE